MEILVVSPANHIVDASIQGRILHVTKLVQNNTISTPEKFHVQFLFQGTIGSPDNYSNPVAVFKGKVVKTSLFDRMLNRGMVI